MKHSHFTYNTQTHPTPHPSPVAIHFVIVQLCVIATHLNTAKIFIDNGKKALAKTGHDKEILWHDAWMKWNPDHSKSRKQTAVSVYSMQNQDSYRHGDLEVRASASAR